MASELKCNLLSSPRTGAHTALTDYQESEIRVACLIFDYVDKFDLFIN